MLRNFIIIIRQLTDADRMKLVWILKTPPPLEWVGYSPQFLRDRPLHDEWYRWLRGGCGGLVHRRVFLGAATCYERLPCYRAASLERRLPKKDVVTGPFAHDCMVAVKTNKKPWLMYRSFQQKLLVQLRRLLWAISLLVMFRLFSCAVLLFCVIIVHWDHICATNGVVSI